MNQQVPNIHRDLQESKEALGDLGKTLPTVQTQVQDIHEMYESGRRKVRIVTPPDAPCPLTSSQGQVLVKDLEWLNTDWYERWRLIIFTSSSPVSLKWKITMRTLFVVISILCCWFSWVALKGAYRAHSHRLVWGDKLMS